MGAREYLSVLCHMSKAKHRIKRKEYLYEIGFSKGISADTVEYLTDFELFSDDHNFECLCVAMQFMKFDRKIRVKEVRFCQFLATSMGYSSQLIYELSPFIYSTPTLSLDKYFLQKVARNYYVRPKKVA